MSEFGMTQRFEALSSIRESNSLTRSYTRVPSHGKPDIQVCSATYRLRMKDDDAHGSDLPAHDPCTHVYTHKQIYKIQETGRRRMFLFILYPSRSSNNTIEQVMRNPSMWNVYGRSQLHYVHEPVIGIIPSHIRNAVNLAVERYDPEHDDIFVRPHVEALYCPQASHFIVRVVIPSQDINRECSNRRIISMQIGDMMDINWEALRGDTISTAQQSFFPGDLCIALVTKAMRPRSLPNIGSRRTVQDPNRSAIERLYADSDALSRCMICQEGWVRKKGDGSGYYLDPMWRHRQCPSRCRIHTSCDMEKVVLVHHLGVLDDAKIKREDMEPQTEQDFRIGKILDVLCARVKLLPPLVSGERYGCPSLRTAWAAIDGGITYDEYSRRYFDKELQAGVDAILARAIGLGLRYECDRHDDPNSNPKNACQFEVQDDAGAGAMKASREHSITLGCSITERDSLCSYCEQIFTGEDIVKHLLRCKALGLPAVMNLLTSACKTSSSYGATCQKDNAEWTAGTKEARKSMLPRMAWIVFVRAAAGNKRKRDQKRDQNRFDRPYPNTRSRSKRRRTTTTGYISEEF